MSRRRKEPVLTPEQVEAKLADFNAKLIYLADRYQAARRELDNARAKEIWATFQYLRCVERQLRADYEGVALALLFTRRDRRLPLDAPVDTPRSHII